MFRVLYVFTLKDSNIFFYFRKTSVFMLTNLVNYLLFYFSFRPESEVYLESLGIIGSVPAAWLILTLILLLIYLLTRCCDTKNNKVILSCSSAATL